MNTVKVAIRAMLIELVTGEMISLENIPGMMYSMPTPEPAASPVTQKIETPVQTGVEISKRTGQPKRKYTRRKAVVENTGDSQTPAVYQPPVQTPAADENKNKKRGGFRRRGAAVEVPLADCIGCAEYQNSKGEYFAVAIWNEVNGRNGKLYHLLYVDTENNVAYHKTGGFKVAHDSPKLRNVSILTAA